MPSKSYFYQLLKISSVPSLMFLLETHFHSVITCSMMYVPYSCRKISQPNIRKGNTLFLRKEKNQSIYSFSKLHNLLEFAFLQHSHAYAQTHTDRGIFQIPKRGIIIIANGNAPCRNLH